MFRVKALALLSVLALAGCSYETPGPAVEEPVGLAVDAPRVTVEEPGSGERRVLEFTDVGNEQNLTYTVTEGFNQELLEAQAAETFQASDIDTATTTLPLDAEVDEASEPAEGQQPATRNVFATVGNPQFDGDGNVDSAEGFQFGWRAVDSGQMSSLRLAAPRDASDEARGIAEQSVMKLTALPIVFPEEEIGEGGRWTVESRVTGESTMLQTTTYTVTALNDDTVTLSVDIDQRPSLGALSFDGQAEGTDLEGKELEVLDSSTESEGEITIDLTQPLPVAGDVTFNTKVTYGTTDSNLRVVQSSSTEMEFSETQE